ncbi:MAG: methyltransferase domain-containing protein [Desulfuromusa sp.]|nr:methyltransferase domain-containing protein [Desulfuromusa sp.]
MIDPLLEKMMRTIFRKKVNVVFNDLNRTEPVSTTFGYERGTPIDRYYIDRFLLSNANHISGKVLEIGDNTCSKKFAGEKVTSFEVLHAVPGNKQATMVGDLTDFATLPENYVDCFICTQTFNFIFEVQKAIVGAHHLLKPGGVLLATVSGISQISRYDAERWGDYWRFTTASIEKLFDPVFGLEIKVETYGNVLAATAFLQGIAVEDLPDASLLDDHDPDYQVLISIVARKTR